MSIDEVDDEVLKQVNQNPQPPPLVRFAHRIRVDPLSAERTRQLLNELRFLKIAGGRRWTGERKNHYSQYTLLWDGDIVLILDT